MKLIFRRHTSNWFVRIETVDEGDIGGLDNGEVEQPQTDRRHNPMNCVLYPDVVENERERTRNERDGHRRQSELRLTNTAIAFGEIISDLVGETSTNPNTAQRPDDSKDIAKTRLAGLHTIKLLESW